MQRNPASFNIFPTHHSIIAISVVDDTTIRGFPLVACSRQIVG
jgi:hypothetical protein